MRTSVAEVERRKGSDDLLGFEGDGDDLADEAEDVFFIVFAVGVVDDAGAGTGGDAVLGVVEGGVGSVAGGARFALALRVASFSKAFEPETHLNL